jgi:diguanylate cyclase (GGDEF)-like protein
VSPGGPASRIRRSAVPLIALLLAIGLLSVAVGAALSDQAREREKLDRQLSGEAKEQSQRLEAYFARARSLMLITAHNPAFRDFYSQPGARHEKIAIQGPELRKARGALSYLEDLFPGNIGEACFIDRTGPENARAVKGRIETNSKLSPDESKASFFKPTFALKPGQVYQARPYISPDTNEWVVSNSTPVPMGDGSRPAIVHFEITVESFRREAAANGGRANLAIVDARTGRVLVDSRYRQAAGQTAKLGRPGDDRFARFATVGARAFGNGKMHVDGTSAAYRRLERTRHNANDWVVVATAKRPLPPWTAAFGAAELAMIVLALLLLGFAVFTFRSSQAELRTAALSDSLTGLANRRRLMLDIERATDSATHRRPVVVALFDLDGFKSYNDAFGHPAGDALLARLAGRLDAAVAGHGRAYRMGGDEFCVLGQPGGATDPLLAAASAALTEGGEGFSIAASYGSMLIPGEAQEASQALRLADQRMYAEKNSGRRSAGRQAMDALVKLLGERYPDLGDHLDDVTELCRRMAERLDLRDEDREPLVQAAALHDIGKAAVPDTILSKPGPLDADEWAFIRQHTVVGERILAAAPALTRAAVLVRSSHERVDGNGYPDGLKGDEIPFGSRIVAVCDAYDAMTSTRPYRPTPMSSEGAQAELRRAAGTQFDPEIVEAFCNLLEARPVPASAIAG